jgi:hypothetical protein
MCHREDWQKADVVLHCDRCGIDGIEGRRVKRYQGIPYCDRCAAKKGLA